jgi:phosphoglycolate phosphatase-like HAD superfamily hydrolase
VHRQGIEVVVFDLDGTLLDSDEALIAPFVALGVPREEISFGHPIEVECARLGLRVEDYVAAYDTTVVRPFEGVESMLDGLGRWAVCSNKARASGLAELGRLGWEPEVAWFADDFGGEAKELAPVLSALGVDPGATMFVGDTEHDVRCAEVAGTAFAWAGWNPRVGLASRRQPVLSSPSALASLVGSA